jgi:hypothetical protein
METNKYAALKGFFPMTVDDIAVFDRNSLVITHQPRGSLLQYHVPAYGPLEHCIMTQGAPCSNAYYIEEHLFKGGSVRLAWMKWAEHSDIGVMETYGEWFELC